MKERKNLESKRTREFRMRKGGTCSSRVGFGARVSEVWAPVMEGAVIQSPRSGPKLSEAFVFHPCHF